MLKIFFLIFLTSIGVQAEPEDVELPFFRKDYTYIPELMAFYKLHKIRTNFTEAISLCRLEGAELFRPQSLIESKMICDKIVRKQAVDIWIAIHDLYSEGHFITLEGVPIEETYSNWNIGEPNNANGNDEEDCIKMGIGDLKFNDLPCRISGNFVCKRNTEGLTENILCPTYDLEYTYNDELDSCYKFHKKPKNWSEAFATCKAEESTLVVINSQAEADFLSKLINNSTIGTIGGNFDSLFLVGFNDLLNEGTYVTVDGKTTAAAGYDNWAPGQPDNFDNKEDCGCIFSDGLLNDVDCNKRALFICEMLLPPFKTTLEQKSNIEPRRN